MTHRCGIVWEMVGWSNNREQVRQLTVADKFVVLDVWEFLSSTGHLFEFCFEGIINASILLTHFYYRFEVKELKPGL